MKWVCEQRPQEINEWGLQLLGVGNFWSGKDKVKGSRRESRRSVRLERKSERRVWWGNNFMDPLDADILSE